MNTDKFKNLRYRLMESESWPLKYMFKFITPNQDGKVEQVKALLPEHGELSFKHTASLKYVAITCVAIMNSADEIIDITEQADRIEGVLIL
ncbi:DUF493 family protein [Mangrovibacterium marinum]|uniref:DUF493 domain-containing protein n=1 Tax=Mangrovibacterium marinum TaxID=1639118 RepID=A0A2T5C3R4_9BACT|nr:DUF493 family protein [Mangrovibacterium marinum]PTN09379.1 hypothetical protein C8N47_105220 [Mangrovibacterium marinum]